MVMRKINVINSMVRDFDQVVYYKYELLKVINYLYLGWKGYRFFFKVIREDSSFIKYS